MATFGDEYQTPGSGRGELLDTPPPSPPARIKPISPSMSLPGDDTMSLLGAPNANGEGVGVSMSTPTGRALAGIMKMMEGVNDIQSVIPGVIPPPIIMMIQALMTEIPEIVRSMQQMTGPGGMLSTMGANDLGGGSGMGGGMGGGGGMSGMGGMGAAGAPTSPLGPMGPMDDSMGEGPRRRPPMLPPM